jgi:hypothetical protein
MARNPCYRCDQRFEGEAQNVYLTYYRGDDNVKFRHLVCAACVLALSDEWCGRALHRDVQGRWTDPDPEESLESLLEGSGEAPVAISWKNGPQPVRSA